VETQTTERQLDTPKRRPGRPKGSTNKKLRETAFSILPSQVIAVQLVAKGVPYTEIGKVLGVAPNTVCNWLSKISDKTKDLSSRLSFYAQSVIESIAVDAAGAYVRAVRGKNDRLALEAARDILMSLGVLKKAPTIIDTPLSPAQIDTELKRILAPLPEEKDK